MSEDKPLQLENIEQYLNGELSPEEVQKFEKRLVSDPEFKSLFDQHKTLLEGLEFSFFQQEQNKMRRLHEEIESEEELLIQEEAGEKKQPTAFRRISIRQMLSAAAIFLVGVLAGNYLINRSPEEVRNFGGEDQGTSLLIEKPDVSLVLISTTSQKSQSQRKNVELLLYDSSNPKADADLRGDTLRAYVPGLLQQLEDLTENSEMIVIVEQKDEPKIETAILQIDGVQFLIPLDYAQSAQLFN